MNSPLFARLAHVTAAEVFPRADHYCSSASPIDREQHLSPGYPPLLVD